MSAVVVPIRPRWQPALAQANVNRWFDAGTRVAFMKLLAVGAVSFFAGFSLFAVLQP